MHDEPAKNMKMSRRVQGAMFAELSRIGSNTSPDREGMIGHILGCEADQVDVHDLDDNEAWAVFHYIRDNY